MERHRYSNEPSTPDHRNPNVFDDEYAIEEDDDWANIGVADGFRPGGAASGRIPNESDAEPATPRSPSIVQQADTNTLSYRASRNSTSKSRGNRDSFAMLNDADTPLPPRRPSHSNTNSQGSGLARHVSVSSISSFTTMGRSSSPFQGATGPSHPYAMYPQGTGVARSSSVTTSSTVRPSQRASLQRPTHPYGMYPQNVIEDPEEHQPPQIPAAIPVGFLGHDTGYHRQTGPDGEELDIIGPDGHTEQLPPYTRFPEEGAVKGPLVEPTPILTPIEPPPSIGGTTSHDALMTAPTQNSVNAEMREAGGPPSESGGSGSTESEKSWKEKSWKERRRTKVLWGTVPLWVLLLVLGLVFIFAVVMGAAIGSLMSKERLSKHDHPPPESVTTATTTVAPSRSMFDATEIPVPTSIAPLPTGAYLIVMGVPQEANHGCLTESAQINAWSCDANGPHVRLSIDNISSSKSSTTMAAEMDPISNPNNTIMYGVQAPEVSLLPLGLVTDEDEPSRGPAWHFQGSYDKLVVLQDEQLSTDDSSSSAKLRKRSAAIVSTASQVTSGHASVEVQPGNKVWYCFWNSTFIEGFIFVDENTTMADASASAASASLTASYYSSTSFIASPTSTATPSTPQATGAITTTTVYQAYASAQTSSPAVRRRSYSADYELPLFPRVFKIEERRLSGSPQPYCQQMQLLDDGEMAPIMASDGTGIVTVDLAEEDPTMSEYYSMESSYASSSSSRRKKRSDPSNACHCQWTWS